MRLWLGETEGHPPDQKKAVVPCHEYLYDALAKRLEQEAVIFSMDIFRDGKDQLGETVKKGIAAAICRKEQGRNVFASRIARSERDLHVEWIGIGLRYFDPDFIERAFGYWSADQEAGTAPTARTERCLGLLETVMRAVRNLPEDQRPGAIRVAEAYYLKNDGKRLVGLADHGGAHVVRDFAEMLRYAVLSVNNWPVPLKKFLDGPEPQAGSAEVNG